MGDLDQRGHEADQERGTGEEHPPPGQRAPPAGEQEIADEDHTEQHPDDLRLDRQGNRHRQGDQPPRTSAAVPLDHAQEREGVQQRRERVEQRQPAQAQGVGADGQQQRPEKGGRPAVQRPAGEEDDDHRRRAQYRRQQPGGEVTDADQPIDQGEQLLVEEEVRVPPRREDEVPVVPFGAGEDRRLAGVDRLVAAHPGAAEPPQVQRDPERQHAGEAEKRQAVAPVESPCGQRRPDPGDDSRPARRRLGRARRLQPGCRLRPRRLADGDRRVQPVLTTRQKAASSHEIPWAAPAGHSGAATRRPRRGSHLSSARRARPSGMVTAAMSRQASGMVTDVVSRAGRRAAGAGHPPHATRVRARVPGSTDPDRGPACRCCAAMGWDARHTRCRRQPSTAARGRWAVVMPSLLPCRP